MSSPLLGALVGLLSGALCLALLEIFFFSKLRRERRRPGIFTWRRLESGEEEVVLEDGRVLRGRGLAWYFHPHGAFAPDWLARWLCDQSRAARGIHAINTNRKKFVFELEEQRRRERRDYGDN